MTIQSKFITGTILFLSSILTLGVIIVYNQLNFKRNVENVISTYNRRVQLSRDLQEYLIRRSRAERNYLLFNEKDYLDTILFRQADIERTIHDFQKIASPTGRRILDDFEIMNNSYKDDIQQMVEFINMGHAKSAKEFARLDMRRKTDKMDGIIEKIVQYNRDIVSAETEETLDKINQNRMFVYMALSMMLLFIAGAFFILWKVKLGFKMLLSGFQSMDEKRFEPIPTHAKAKDEISFLENMFNRMVLKIKIFFEELQQLAVRDGLTGLFNHRYFQERLIEEIRRASRSNLLFSLAMIDVDNFKQVNDTYGHASGDIVLKHVCDTIRDHLRKSDFLARYGGEEFAIILLETNKETAFEVMEKVRMAVEKWTVLLPKENRSIRITISSGISTYPTDGMTKDEIIQKADSALYKSKLNGRNRTEIFLDESKAPVRDDLK